MHDIMTVIIREGVEKLAVNVADDIRAKETEGREIVAKAKQEAARITAAARTAAEQSIKEARQKSHRSFREQVKETEKTAEQNAVKVVEAGRQEADLLYRNKQADTAKVTDWLTKEVMATNGAN